MSDWITWDVQDLETGERFPYLFERATAPDLGDVVTVTHHGRLRRVRRVFSAAGGIAVRNYDGQIESTLPTKRNAQQLGLPMAPGYDPTTGLPRFTSRAAMNKYAADLSRSKRYGQQEVKWKGSDE